MGYRGELVHGGQGLGNKFNPLWPGRGAISLIHGAGGGQEV